jgi:hypothetical protein
MIRKYKMTINSRYFITAKLKSVAWYYELRERKLLRSKRVNFTYDSWEDAESPDNFIIIIERLFKEADIPLIRRNQSPFYLEKYPK